MTENISKLITALGAQRDIYIELYELSQNKRKAIEEQDLDTLNQVVRDEQPLLIRLTESERERLLILAQFSKALQLPEDKITMQDILDICPPSFITPLKRIQAELSNALQSQISINDVNRKLIESRLEYISFMMDTANSDINNSYNTTGNDARKKPAGPRMIDLGV